MIQDLSEDRGFAELAEAKRQGHKFMKIYLHRSKIGRNQRKIIISGAVTLVGIRVGLDEFGGEQYHFEERRGDSMVFEFDPAEREFICWLYDDPGRGYFSPVGYNRDLLATHWEQDFFVIKDPEVYADVKLRFEYIQQNPQDQKIQKTDDIITNLTSGATVQEIDNQIEFLRQRKEQIVVMDERTVSEITNKEDAYKKLKKEREDAEIALKKSRAKTSAKSENKGDKDPKSEKKTGNEVLESVS